MLLSNPRANEREESTIGKTVWQLLVFILALMVGCDGGAQSPESDWPPLIIYYEFTATMDDGEEGTIKYKLTYYSRDHWREDIIAAPPLSGPSGTFSLEGMYDVVKDGLHYKYDPNSDNVHMAVLEDGTSLMPGMGDLSPMPLERLTRIYGREPVPVETDTRSCFEEVCQENARGWSFDLKQQHVYANDVRGIPIRLDMLDITEVLVNDVQRPFRGH